MHYQTKYTLYGMFLTVVLMLTFIGAVWIFLPEEDDEVRYEQFTALTGTNDDLEDLNSFHNLGFYEDYYYWCELSGDDFIIKRVDSITGSTSTEHTYDITPASGSNWLFFNTILKILYIDSKWYLCAVICVVVSDGGSTTIMHTIFKNLSDSGAYVDDDTELVPDLATVKMIDMFSFGSQIDMFYYIAETSDHIRAASVSIADGSASRDSIITIISLLNHQAVYAGGMVDSDYVFYVEDSANNIKRIVVDDTYADTVTVDSDLTLANSDSEVQKYWSQDDLEFIMDEEYFYIRYDGGTWLSISDTGTTTNGIVWDYDSSNQYKINYVIWKDTIFKILPSGRIVKIQPFTDDAYVGWADWFANGADTIYQWGLSSFAAHDAMITTEVEKAPLAMTTTVTEPSNEYYSFHRDAITGLVDWGTASNPDLSAWTDSSGADCTVSIIEKFNGHRNVMKLDDQSAAARCNFYQTFADQTNTFCEIVIATSDSTKESKINFYTNDPTLKIKTRTNGGFFQIDDQVLGWQSVFAMANDTWYYLKFTFDATGNTVKINVDGGADNDYDTLAYTEIGLIQFETLNGDTGYQFYVDGLGYSWDGYISGSGVNTHIFEGFRMLPTTKGGFVKTTYVSGIALDLKQTVTLAAVNSTPHAWIKSIIDTYCSYMWYDTGIDDQYIALDFPAINGKSVGYCFRLISLLKQHWFYYLPDMEVMWDDGTKYSGQNIVQGSDPIW